ncbi:MAG: antibiotic biosynthesis monooxygenase [Firmicutes bacterium]|nr:antibiotic biosynthesis monooxygenase [Bacillota bacterium]MBQ5797191.1 antibiotic biosynthesis monooxygenase [Bacillota bacterium]
MIVLHVTYKLLQDNAQEYIDALETSGIPQLCREEEGNIRYDYFLDPAHKDQVLLVELWKDMEAFELHKQFDHFKRLGEFKEKFVKDTDIQRFTAESFK